jgi:CheY-like chemotaxis protein
VATEAVSGEELTETIVARQPSLGFVSMQLSGLSGPEAVALARKRGAALPCLVLVSSRVFPQWQELAQSLSAYEVLKIPLDAGHIASLLRACAPETSCYLCSRASG